MQRVAILLVFFFLNHAPISVAQSPRANLRKLTSRTSLAAHAMETQEFNNPMPARLLRRYGIMQGAHLVAKRIESRFFSSSPQIRLRIAWNWRAIQRRAAFVVACNSVESMVECSHNWAFVKRWLAGAEQYTPVYNIVPVY